MNDKMLQQFLATGGLFQKVDANDFGMSELKSLHNGHYKFDSYCSECKYNSTFKSQTSYYNKDEWKENENSSEDEKLKDLLSKLDNKLLIFECARDSYHRIRIILHTSISYKWIEKYGHFPSLDSSIEESLSRYNNYLSEDSNELQCALKLHNQGLHIGAFVYLRRVFERQIIKEYEENKSTFSIDDDMFYKKYKMEQKIDLLKNYLPQFVVNNKRSLYPLLSKGVHEWAEDECGEQFSVVYQSIELILDKVLATMEQKQKELNLTNAITELNTKP